MVWCIAILGKHTSRSIPMTRRYRSQYNTLDMTSWWFPTALSWLVAKCLYTSTQYWAKQYKKQKKHPVWKIWLLMVVLCLQFFAFVDDEKSDP